MVTASISGIRGVFNSDLNPSDVMRFSSNFVHLTGSKEFLLAKDTRTTGEILGRVVSSAILREGGDIIDYGVISTPALFRESRLKEKPGIIVTASHNEPEWNGLKFVNNGSGIREHELEKILEARKYPPAEFKSGKVRDSTRFSYNDELVAKFGERSCEGVRVVLDMGGGAATKHAPVILRKLGCIVKTLGDTLALFYRKIDPTADPLTLLSQMVRKQSADIGLAFDGDGDRLVIVDSEGAKKTGDYMLTLALKEMITKQSKPSVVVVSVDTTQAVDELVQEAQGRLVRSKVGESNVLQTMIENGATLGGEGSSGGLIDSSFNNCRDSMVAALTIVKAIKQKGTKIYDRVKSYHQFRTSLQLPRSKALRAIRRIQKENPEAETLDGVKIRLSRHSWVLIRASGTEELVRISAESPSKRDAEKISQAYIKKVKRLSA